MFVTNPLRVLIVDDHPAVREGLAQMIATQTDMAVVGSASDGQEAVALIEALNPDVTVLDVRLPGLNGLEVIQAIRQQTEQGRFILMSSAQGEQTEAQALEVGASAFLFKEAFGEELLAAIRQVAHSAPATATPNQS
ncbi:MAG: response regulator transcription factor [Acidobacteria bacterium]|nr:response regulator transcription factor [Acidobacteriota bacterium]